jgi:hypothetical protein
MDHAILSSQPAKHANRQINRKYVLGYLGANETTDPLKDYI